MSINISILFYKENDLYWADEVQCSFSATAHITYQFLFFGVNYCFSISLSVSALLNKFEFPLFNGY